MRSAERLKILTEQADSLRREAEKLNSLAQTASITGQLNLHPAGLKVIANILETIGKNVKSVADDIQVEG